MARPSGETMTQGAGMTPRTALWGNQGQDESQRRILELERESALLTERLRMAREALEQITAYGGVDTGNPSTLTFSSSGHLECRRIARAVLAALGT